MKKHIDIINLDNYYLNMDFYKKFNYKVLNLTKLRGVSYLCSYDTLNKIRAYMTRIRPLGLTYLASGNYHYLTSIILEGINEPFSLVLLDNHTEMLDINYDGFISCGSWLSHVIENNKYLKEVYILGVSEKYLDDLDSRYYNIKNFHIISRENLVKDKSLINKVLPSYKTYLSIDKDVFSRNLAITNWDQGSMDFDSFRNLIENIKHKIFAADLCGEDTINPQSSHRLVKAENLSKNNKLNNEICKILFF